MINNVSLKNFKSYKEESFKLSMLSVFCGNNSVGKSTAIQAISIPLQSKFSETVSLNGGLTEVGFINDIHHKKPKGEDLKIELTIGSDVYSWGYEDYSEHLKLSNNELISLDKDRSVNSVDFGEILDNFQYLRAERYGPRDNYELAKSSMYHSKWLGSKGEFTAEFLSNVENLKRFFVGGRFVADGGELDHRLHSSKKNQVLHDHINAWMSEISPGIEVSNRVFEEASVAVSTYSQNAFNSLKPQNVGFGVSYVLGIVTALLLTRPGGLVIIENPEAHLHPRGQSYLGRLIALTALAGVQVIVETHSDHLLNGIRVITRINQDFDPKLFTLYYISQGEQQSNVEKITITKDGKLSNWPDGFFDQQAQDMFMIMTGQTQLPTKGA